MKLICGFVLMCALAVSACGSDSNNPTAPSPAPTLNVAFSATDLRTGSGATATVGRSVIVKYTGWTYSPTATENKGIQFDSNSTGYPFTVGTGVIQGFSMGVNGMQVGGIRRVVIPPNLAYGNNSPSASIRPNETLLFEIELVAVQ